MEPGRPLGPLTADVVAGISDWYSSRYNIRMVICGLIVAAEAILLAGSSRDRIAIELSGIVFLALGMPLRWELICNQAVERTALRLQMGC
jgi:hypothetical protein